MMPLLWRTSIQGTSPSRDSKLDPEKCSYRVLSILPNQPVRNQWNCQEKMERHFSVETKFPIASSDPFTFWRKFWLLRSKVGLETRIFGNGTASLGRSGPTGERGPPLEVDHFERKISTRTKAFHLILDLNFRKFWHNGKYPWSYLYWRETSIQGQETVFTDSRHPGLTSFQGTPEHSGSLWTTL